MIGCIEYDGSKPSAVRPGPPNACSICWSTSLEPLAAHTLLGVERHAGGRGEVGGEVGAQRDGVAVGVAVAARRDLGDGRCDVGDQRRRRAGTGSRWC